MAGKSNACCCHSLFSSTVFNKLEAWGYVWILLVRGVSWTTWVFTAVAVLKLANGEVGCTQTGHEIGFNETMNRTQTIEEADIWEVECEGKVSVLGSYMTPSSVIPFTTSVGLFVSTVLTPISGAIIDRTNRRKAITFGSLGVYVAINAFQSLIGESTWLIVLLLQNIFGRIAFALHVSCIAAYCTEIAENEEETIALQSVGRVFETGAMVGTLFAVLIGGGVLGIGEDVVKKAAFGQVLATVISAPVFFYAMSRFENRPALNKTQGSVFTSGFVSIIATVKDLWSNNRYVLQYLIGISFNDAANGNVFVLFPIYAMLQVKLEDPALFTGIAMIMCIPGALITKSLATKFGLRRQLGNILVGNAVITLLLILVFYKEGATTGILIVAIAYGLTIGGTYPMQKGLYMRLIPAGQEVEFQGLYTFFGQLLAPLPSAWFVYCQDSALGGKDDSMRVGMALLAVFFLCAYLLTSLFLDEAAALDKVAGTLHKRVRPDKVVDGGKVTPEP